MTKASSCQVNKIIKADKGQEDRGFLKAIFIKKLNILNMYLKEMDIYIIQKLYFP